MNTKNCITVEAELIQSLVNNKIEVKFGDVFIAINLLCKQNEINSSWKATWKSMVK